MTHTWAVPFMGRWVVADVDHSIPKHVYGPVFADASDALLLKEWIDRYHSDTAMDPPMDVLEDVAGAIVAFDLSDWNAQEISIPLSELLDAVLCSPAGKAALRGMK